MWDTLLTLKAFYERFKKYNPIAFFFGGFTWDSVTLKRIDQFFDNFILLIYLLVLGVLVVLVSLVQKDVVKSPLLLKYREWYPLGLQFFLGGLFSAYVVFYFKSASFTKTFLFLGLLILLLVANEFLEKRLTNLYLLISLYFLACFSFFIFFVPIAFKAMNLATFLLGGLLSLLLIGGILFFLLRKSVIADYRHLIKVCLPVVSIYLFLNLLYWQNWIPPVPLSLKSGGIYHHASKSSQSDLFTLRFEQPRWYQVFKSSDDPFRYAAGDTVSCFTAIFAPTKLTKKVYHHWQQYSVNREEWLTTDRLGYDIVGYRDSGYRGFTRKRNVSPGKWRVDIETEERLILGRISFEIEEVDERVPLTAIFK